MSNGWGVPKTFLQKYGSNEHLREWIKLIGLFVGGYLTIHHFFYVEKPSEEIHPKIEAKLTRDGIRSGSGCQVNFDVNISNPGISPFDVDEVEIRFWESEPAKLGANRKGFVDIKNLQQSVPAFLEFLDNTNPAPLLGHYSPRSSYHQTFSWQVAKPMPLFYLFRVDVKNKGKDLGSAGQWSEGICP